MSEKDPQASEPRPPVPLQEELDVLLSTQTFLAQPSPVPPCRAAVLNLEPAFTEASSEVLFTTEHPPTGFKPLMWLTCQQLAGWALHRPVRHPFHQRAGRCFPVRHQHHQSPRNSSICLLIQRSQLSLIKTNSTYVFSQILKFQVRLICCMSESDVTFVCLLAQEGDSADEDVRLDCPESASIKLQVENVAMGSDLT